MVPILSCKFLIKITIYPSNLHFFLNPNSSSGVENREKGVLQSMVRTDPLLLGFNSKPATTANLVQLDIHDSGLLFGRSADRSMANFVLLDDWSDCVICF